MYVSLLSTGHRFQGLHNKIHLHLSINQFVHTKWLYSEILSIVSVVIVF